MTGMLEPFRQRHAVDVAGWAATPEEATWWGGHATRWPVDASALSAWHADPDVRPYVLVDAGAPAGYGEVWVDEEEQEVELGRIVVAPGGLAASRSFSPVPRSSPSSRVPSRDSRLQPGQPAAYAWLRRDLP